MFAEIVQFCLLLMLFFKIRDEYYLDTGASSFMIEQLCTVFVMSIYLYFLQEKIMKMRLPKARKSIVVYEAIRSIIYITELFIMILVQDCFHLYNEYILELHFFFRLEGWILYGQLFFWSWLFLYKPCLAFCVGQEAHRGAPGAINYEALVDRDMRIAAEQREAANRDG